MSLLEVIIPENKAITSALLLFRITYIFTSPDPYVWVVYYPIEMFHDVLFEPIKTAEQGAQIHRPNSWRLETLMFNSPSDFKGDQTNMTWEHNGNHILPS